MLLYNGFIQKVASKTTPIDTEAERVTNTEGKGMNTLREKIRKIRKDDSRYHRDAYYFVMESLKFTAKQVGEIKETNHITGRQLLEGIKVRAIKEFGPMAASVLNEWGLRSTIDFGHIAHNLVSNGIIKKADDDFIDDFRDVFSFYDAFIKPFAFNLTSYEAA